MFGWTALATTAWWYWKQSIKTGCFDGHNTLIISRPDHCFRTMQAGADKSYFGCVFFHMYSTSYAFIVGFDNNWIAPNISNLPTLEPYFNDNAFVKQQIAGPERGSTCNQCDTYRSIITFKYLESNITHTSEGTVNTARHAWYFHRQWVSY